MWGVWSMHHTFYKSWSTFMAGSLDMEQSPSAGGIQRTKQNWWREVNRWPSSALIVCPFPSTAIWPAGFFQHFVVFFVHDSRVCCGYSYVTKYNDFAVAESTRFFLYTFFNISILDAYHFEISNNASSSLLWNECHMYHSPVYNMIIDALHKQVVLCLSCLYTRMI